MVHSITLKKILSAIMIIILVASLFSLSACKKKEPERGEQGIQGEKGDAGEKGENGSTPYIGTNGNWWIDAFDTGVLAAGKDGTNGANGLPGINGKDGVTPGFKFEESEKILYVSYDSGATWQPMIDLTGLCINGVDGKDGLPGTDGKDGVGVSSVTVNDNGELLITLSDGTVNNAGTVAGERLECAGLLPGQQTGL